MLTKEQIQENRIKYLELIAKLGFDMGPFVAYLDAYDYFTAPYTIMQYRAYAGGLCQTALDFYGALSYVNKEFYNSFYSEEDIIKVALFRDLYRAELFEYNAAKNCYQNATNRRTFGDIYTSSYIIGQEFTTFTQEQAMAILHGQANSMAKDLGKIRTDFPLVSLMTITELLVFLRP